MRLSKFVIPVLCSSLSLGATLAFTDGGKWFVYSMLDQLPKAAHGLPSGAEWPAPLALDGCDRVLIVPDCGPCAATWLGVVRKDTSWDKSRTLVLAVSTKTAKQYLGSDYTVREVGLEDLNKLRVAAQDPPYMVEVASGVVVTFETVQQHYRNRRAS